MQIQIMKLKSSYSFTVTASDAAGNTSSATTVTFSINDVDDTAPVNYHQVQAELI